MKCLSHSTLQEERKQKTTQTQSMSAATSFPDVSIGSSDVLAIAEFEEARQKTLKNMTADEKRKGKLPRRMYSLDNAYSITYVRD